MSGRWPDPLSRVGPNIQEVTFKPQEREQMAKYFDEIGAVDSARAMRQSKKVGARRIDANNWDWFYQ